MSVGAAGRAGLRASQLPAAKTGAATAHARTMPESQPTLHVYEGVTARTKKQSEREAQHRTATTKPCTPDHSR